VPVEIKAGSFPVTGQAKVIVVGNAAGHSTLALELEPNTAAVTSSSSVFNVAESAKNVAVIVIDIDQQGVALVRNLHTVFPSDPIVAVTAHASHVEAARKNGASAAVVIDTPSAIVTAVVKAIIANKS
jgi:CheY-like chemotaxis protein